MELKGRRVLVVGLGLSGLAAARLLIREGARVKATDLRPAGQLRPEVKDLEALGVELHLGGHPERLFSEAQLIVISPGVPLYQPGLVAARAQGVEIIGELGLAASLLKIPMVAVSGTNGKSTTTALIAHLLQAGGRRVFLGGNIGRALSQCLTDEPQAELAVVEVSSFQLEALPFFKPKVAVMTNLSPDHLDRHPNYEAYVQVKARLWADLGPQDALVLNRADQTLPSLARDCQARLYLFDLNQSQKPGTDDPGAYLTDRARALL
ncbi:MAG: UDP-N-acetylmuramoyl-L-alanine--D-glutamate ligase, partial [Deltaproteobacteria bacterium]|nr:UDP-N-acetylmuramoyl-L-alanine--D-glutamate ligase [Deltaproteobacteria bacterium]